MLTINNLSIDYQQPILLNFSYQFQVGQFYQITSENYTCQSSFLRAITNITPFAKGEVLIDEQPYSGAKEKVFFFESCDWFNLNFNSLDYLKFVKHQWQSHANLTDELAFLGISEYAKVPIHKYTKAMKQKLLITMYFISGATYYLMDEITNHLDQETCLKVYARLDEEVSEQNKCVIATSHQDSGIEVSNLHKMVFQKQMIYEVVK